MPTWKKCLIRLAACLSAFPLVWILSVLIARGYIGEKAALLASMFVVLPFIIGVEWLYRRLLKKKIGARLNGGAS